MFKLRLSQYINKNLVEHNLTYKNLSDRSGVPISSIHSYAQGKVGSPNEDNLIRIAAVFGDGPEVIQAMRRESLESTTKENLILANSDDPELVEKYASLIRSNVAQILEEYRVQAASQQTEIINHADKRVEDAKAQYAANNAEISRQCREHEIEYKKQCDSLVDAELRAFAAEKKGCEDMIARLEKNIAYLRLLVRNLSIVAAIFAAYSLYSYKSFDIADTTQGLYRGGATNLPLILAFAALCYVLVSIVANLVRKKTKMVKEQ